MKTAWGFQREDCCFSFWETWCPSCRHELIQLDGLAEKYKDDDLVIITVNTATRDTRRLSAVHEGKQFGPPCTLGSWK